MKSRMQEICTYGSVRGNKTSLSPNQRGGSRDLSTRRRYLMEILNRKARYDYEIEDTYEAGMVLTGTEIKSIRQGKANIKDSYAIIKSLNN